MTVHVFVLVIMSGIVAIVVVHCVLPWKQAVEWLQEHVHVLYIHVFMIVHVQCTCSVIPKTNLLSTSPTPK